MGLKNLLLLILFFLFFNQLTSAGLIINTSGNENEIKHKKQVGIKAGYLFDHKISNAKGDHGLSYETSVDNIIIEQSFAAGLSFNYYLSDHWGLETCLMYSQACFPQQQILLDGFTLNQPKSDLNFYSISVGPFLKYSDSGTWQNFNPYISFSLLLLYGTASDASLYPVYAAGGSTDLSGTGFNFSIGTQYLFNNIGISIEYRFEFIELNANHFRSFTNGLSMNKSGSSVLSGIFYQF
jgi:hypothetical protein